MNESLKKVIFPTLAPIVVLLIIGSALNVLERSTGPSTPDVLIEDSIEIKSQHNSPIYLVSDKGAIRQKPNLVLNHKKTIDGEELFSVDYEIDSFGRRKTPQTGDQIDSHLVMLGCSYTFGHGLKANETLPYYLGKAFKNSRAYNYGMQAYGTYHITRLIESIDLKKEVKESKGIMIYQFLNFHIVRSTGLHYWSSLFPYTPTYDSSDGELSYVGLKEDVDWITTNFLKAFKRVPFLPSLNQFHQMVRQTTHDREFYQTYALAIERMKNKYLESFPEGRFVMMIHPDEKLPNYLLGLLKEKGVEILRFDFSLTRVPQYFIHPEHEPHPSPLLNQELAEVIHDKLQNN